MNPGKSVSGVRVRGQERWNFSGTTAFTDPSDRLKKIGHIVGIITDFCRIFHPQLIRLTFMFYAIAQQHQLNSLINLISKLPHRWISEEHTSELQSLTHLLF